MNFKYIVLGLVTAFVMWAAVATYNSGFLQNAPFPTLMLALAAFAAAAYGIYQGYSSLVVVPMLAVLTSCSFAKSNQQVLVSSDCGSNRELIEAGTAVPHGTVNPCHMKVVIPNYPMQGDTKYTVNMAERVKVKVEIDYDYSIINPLAFINQAKILGSANAHADDVSEGNDNKFEQAENQVIDKRIRDVSKELFLHQDIVEMDQNVIEDSLLVLVNERLKPLGVQLNFITLTFLLDSQTNTAIDVATAFKIYQSRGLEEVGKQVISAQAGATKITINQPQETPHEE